MTERDSKLPLGQYRRAVFLDRDGVINKAIVKEGKPYPPKCLKDFEILPGVADALQALRNAGFLLIVVTNQPDVARGTQTLEIIGQMHAHLMRTLPLDAIKVCFGTSSDTCEYYKPRPGMLLEAAREYLIDLGNSAIVGDRWRDIEAGKAAGTLTIFVDYGYHEKRPESPDAIVHSFPEAAALLLSDTLRKSQPMASSSTISQLKIKIFADGADLEGIKEMYALPYVRGFTTNPTLMRKAGVQNYKAFALKVIDAIPDRPVSFEVFADEFDEMERQAHEIATWGKNVNVKIPITDTKGRSAAPLVGRLSKDGIVCNVTAIFTLEQTREICSLLDPNTPVILSIFAGRIADTGVDPVPLMTEAIAIAKPFPKAEVLWASPREILNIVQADEIGCHVITVTNEILKKLDILGKDLEDFSRETVAMFYRDAKAAAYSIIINDTKP